jgi:hypothetical protein
MNKIFSLLVIFILSISTISIQLYDLCSNNIENHSNPNICLNILGCCYVRLESKLNNLNSCFKIYKEDSKTTCQHFRSITKEYGNDLLFCQCYELYKK